MPIIKALHGIEKQETFPSPFYKASAAPLPKEGDNKNRTINNFFNEH